MLASKETPLVNLLSRLYHGYDDIFLGKLSYNWIGKNAFDVEVANRMMHLLFCMYSSWVSQMRGNVHLVQAIVLPSVCCSCSTIIVFGIHSMGKHFNHIIRWRFQSSLLPCRCSANARDVLSFLKLFNILFCVQTKCSYFFLALGAFS